MPRNWLRFAAIACLFWLWIVSSHAAERPNPTPAIAPAAAVTPHSATTADQHLTQGLQQFQAHQVEQAIASWQTALSLYQQQQNAVGEGKTLARLGMGYVTLGQYQKAIQALEAFMPLAKSLNDQQTEAEALGNLGIAYKETGRYGQAIAIQQQAGKIMRSLGNRSALGQVLTNLGNAFEAVGDYSKAMIAHQQSLKIARQAGDRLGECVALGNLGAIYANLGKDEDAIAAFETSLKLAQDLQYTSGQTNALLNLGSTYHALRKLDRAIQFYEDTLKLAQQSGDRRREADALGSLGLAYEDKKDFNKALEYHRQKLEIARSLNDPEAEGVALNNLGHALLGAGQLDQAETQLRAAIRLLDDLRSELNDAYKVSIFDTQIHTYSLLQQVLIAANKPETALEAAEWGRARAFTELLAKRTTQPSLKPKTETGTAPLNNAAPIRVADIKRIAREQQATLIEYAIVPDDDFKFRGKQRAREAELYIWVVPPTGQVQFRRVDLKTLWQQELALNKVVAIARNCLYPPFDCAEVAQPDASSTPAPSTTPRRRKNPALHRLHQLLIEPIADVLPQDPNARLIIIPQESLFLVPFAALQDPEGAYLIEQHTLLTAPAIQVLDFTRQLRSRQQATQTDALSHLTPALIVGNPTMPIINDQPLSPLPRSAEEAQQIADLLNTKPLIGDAAQKSKAVQEMAQAKLIHLATHGLLEYGRDLGETDVPGAIALAPDRLKTGNNPDGILTASEILNLRLQAELVVLSACDTGRGRITGDGVIGLSRAFVSAGAPSVMVSLWAVSDVSTAKLMVAFYQNLKQDPDKAKALRAAMLHTMETYARPLDWAAFTLVGEAE